MAKLHLVDDGGYLPFPENAERFVDAELAAEVGIWRWEIDRGVIELSERVREICGLDDAFREATVESFLAVVHPADRRRTGRALSPAGATRRPFVFRTRVLRPSDGGERTVLFRGSASDAPDEMVGICQDLTGHEQATDVVGQLERRLADIVDQSPSLISIKDLNHRYQMVAKDVAKLAGRPVAEVIGRTATEVFPEIGADIDAQAEEALATHEAVHSDLLLTVDGQVRTFHVVSFALTDEHGAPVEICCITTDVTDSRRRQREGRLRREVSALISDALADERMIAFGQPIVDLQGGGHVADELLIRLALPDGSGLMQPASFLPLAERFGLVGQIDVWMVDRALEQAVHREAQVNLSAVTFSDARAREAILSALRRAPEIAPRLIFEITETAVAHHVDVACEFAAALTELGCRLALDDFGTGFGSFTYLRRLPLHYLKIDRSFVTGLTDSASDCRVVSSIISIAQQFELATIAEGVEDAATLRILGDLGADYVQGFYLGRPGPLTALADGPRR